MAGKKKKKVAKKVTKKRTSNFKGRMPGAKNKPKPKVYRVLNEMGYVLGDFANLDAACDAIRAQADLHSSLRTPSVPPAMDPMEADVAPTYVRDENENVIALAPEPTAYNLPEIDWTIVVRRAEPGDVVHPEW